MRAQEDAHMVELSIDDGTGLLGVFDVSAMLEAPGPWSRWQVRQEQGPCCEDHSQCPAHLVVLPVTLLFCNAARSQAP